MTKDQFKVKYPSMYVRGKEPYILMSSVLPDQVLMAACKAKGRKNTIFSVRFFAQLRKRCEEYMVGGDYHSENGPARIYLDDDDKVVQREYYQDGQAHREDGPAVEYLEDGRRTPSYKYFWRGVEVDEKTIMHPEAITLQDIADASNIETQRVMIERMGWLKYLKLVDPVVVDECADPISGTHQSLLDIRATFHREGRILLCACPSTGRMYPIYVPDTTTTCEQAQKYLIGDRMAASRIIGAS